MEPFQVTDNDEVTKMLEDLRALPLVISQAEENYKKAKDALRKATLAYELSYHKAFLVAEGKNVAEKEALAIINSQRAAEEKLKAEEEASMAEIKYNHAMNTWVSLRKEAGLQEARIKQQL